MKVSLPPLEYIERLAAHARNQIILGQHSTLLIDKWSERNPGGIGTVNFKCQKILRRIRKRGDQIVIPLGLIEKKRPTVKKLTDVIGQAFAGEAFPY